MQRRIRFVNDPTGDVPPGVPVVWVVGPDEYQISDGCRIIGREERQFVIPLSNIISIELNV